MENPSEGKSGTFHVGNESGNFSVPDDDVDFYRYISLSLLKTVVMMIGDFDASSMSFDNGSCFVFLLFVFLMTIVSMNLLNSLAISDTQAIKKDAELVAHKSRVKLLYHLESEVYGGPIINRCSFQHIDWFFSLGFLLRGRLKKAICLFPDTFQDGYLSVVLNHGTWHTDLKIYSDKEIRPDRCGVGKCKKGVLIAVKDIADRKNEQYQREEKQIPDSKAKVEEDLKGQLTKLEGLLKQLINNIEQK
jgi:hypothetical protein